MIRLAVVSLFLAIKPMVMEGTATRMTKRSISSFIFSPVRISPIRAMNTVSSLIAVRPMKTLSEKGLLWSQTAS